MSALSITCLFPFRRARIVDSVVLEDPELGTAIFNKLEPDMRYNPICSVCPIFRITDFSKSIIKKV